MDAFRDGVRARDRKCVITGVPNLGAEYDEWLGFETAHIFPLAHENAWVEGDYSRWITDMEHRSATAKMNSCQNGLLLAAHMHITWDLYKVSVNPDVDDFTTPYSKRKRAAPLILCFQDGYKIIYFGIDSSGIDGKTLGPVCRNPNKPNNPHRVSDELLRWHFRQAVLANMRGAGEPVFEHEFGADMLAEIREGPKAQERFELEIATRLYGFRHDSEEN